MFAPVAVSGSTGMNSGDSWLSHLRVANMPVTVSHSKGDLNLMMVSEGFFVCTLEVQQSAPAGVAQWIECWPTNQRVASSIPS